LRDAEPRGPDTILGGRILAGIAGGLGTGAASALVVAAIGTTGRAVTATGNTIGAILGVSGAQLAVLVLTADARKQSSSSTPP
jgi:hypothetical protein